MEYGGNRYGHARHFGVGQLLLYTLPAMAMTVLGSVYTIVDGFFVSNFAGKTAFASVNLIWPFIGVLAPIGFMMGSGGSAIIARLHGQGDDRTAQSHFSLFVCFTAVVGLVFALVGAAVMDPVAHALGADEDMQEIAVLYGRICMIGLPVFMLQYTFQGLFSAAGLPKVGLAFTAAAGLTNVVLDFALVGMMGLGYVGAAAATVASQLVGGVGPLAYFARENPSYLRLRKPSKSARVLAEACVNGSSEMVAVVAASVIGMVYNWQLMGMLGQDGVAAYGTIMYVGYIFAAVYEGYCMGSSPLMSYQHGARNAAEKRSLLRKSLPIMGMLGIAMTLVSHLLARPLAMVFTGYDQGLLELTVHGFGLYSFAFLSMGFSMYGSALFTSLGNGPISALISMLRTFVFEIGSVMLLPIVLAADGIWLAAVVAELVSALISAFFLLALGRHYDLLGKKRKQVSKAGIRRRYYLNDYGKAGRF